MAAFHSLAVTTILGLALAGCGGGDEPRERPARDSASDSTQDKAGGWTGAQANTYDTARVVCGEPSPRTVAKELGLPADSDEFTIAEEYATGSTEEHRQPALEGCLEGLGGGG